MKQILINEIGKRKERDRQKRDVKRGFESYTNHIDEITREYREKGKHIENLEISNSKDRPSDDSHRNIKRVKEETNSGTEYTALKDNNGEGTYICKYCGQVGCCETECSDCYAWWSREGKKGRMKGYDGRVREYREKGKHIDAIDTIDREKRDKTLEKQAIDGDIGFLEYCDEVKKRESGKVKEEDKNKNKLSKKECKEKHKDEIYQLMHPSIDPEIDEPIWYCPICDYTFKGGW